MQRPARQLTPVQIVVSYYLIAIIISMLLLGLPISHRLGVELSFIDLLFTAVSAISVTGLTVVNTAETFSPVGILFLSIVLQFGGIGIMTLGTFIWLLMGKRITMRERQLIMTDQNRTTLSGLVILMKNILVMALTIEAVGTLILGTYFYGRYFDGFLQSYYYGFFTALSAFTNAGFDVFGDSLVRFEDDYFVQLIHILLMIGGAIGFPVLVEVYQYFSREHPNFRFSLFTKLTVSTYMVLLLAGWLAIWLLERNNWMTGMSWHQQLFYSLFNSVTSRNTGLATMDVAEFSLPTQWLLSVLMFIGASPSSVGGGIRTTTFAILFFLLLNHMRGRQEIRLFKREIHPEDTQKAVLVALTAIFLVVAAVFILTITEAAPLMDILFEVCSAFGTTGLSMGLTSDLSTVGKGVIVVVMFIGRIGIFSLLSLFQTKGKKPAFHYAKERVIVG